MSSRDDRFAQISSISPTSFNLFAAEDNIDIFGSNLVGDVATFVVFDGTIFIEPITGGGPPNPGHLVAPVPTSVTAIAGTHSVEVHAVDSTGTRVYGPVSFTVVDPGGGGGAPPSINIPEILFQEATSTSGAVVTFDVTAFDDAGPVAVSCSPPSGSLFPMGGTSVSCSATNANGTSFASFTVIVADVTPPVLTLPADFTTTGPVVSFTATAVDNLNGSVPVSCTPPSGSSFLSGDTTVFCIAFDSSFNPGFGSFQVTVTGGAPMITVPDFVLVEATGPGGAVATYSVTATEGATISCTPPSGSNFPIGVTTVTCTATNDFGSTGGSFPVQVVDASAPVLTLPGDITVQATTPAGTIVSFTATAVDVVDGPVAVTCEPPSGSLFPVGTTEVVCSAADSSLIPAVGSFFVNVVNTPPPVLTLPGTITAEATGPAGAVVSYSATADGGEVVSCAPPSGSTFPLGTTTVTCSATNAGGTTTGTFDVNVVDTTPPVLTLPSQITAEATSPAGALVTYVATATDLVDGDVAVQCVPPSGSTFALGTTNVVCTATDTRDNVASSSFQVIVEDTTPPEIVDVTATPNHLWPPNHKMVNVTVDVDAVDAADPSPVTQIVSVSSNQPIDGTGDGDTAPDWIITGPLSLQLRSERSHGDIRIYTITVEAVDASGNRSTSTVEVVVADPRKAGKFK